MPLLPCSLTTSSCLCAGSRHRPKNPCSESGELQLKLCECERAAGAPNGLSCDKAGWFVSSWERQGQWVTPFSIAGSGTVPLSHAICCRPCLPSELPPDSSGRIPSGEKPVAVVSLACHVSTDETPGHCEVAGSSLVAGVTLCPRGGGGGAVRGRTCDTLMCRLLLRGSMLYVSEPGPVLPWTPRVVTSA